MNKHLNPEELLALLDGDLPATVEHARDCAECRGRRQTIEQGEAEYRAYYRQVVIPLAPRPPAPWRSLAPGIEVIDARRKARRPWRLWAGALAAAALLMLAYAGYQHIPSVQAAELLKKAVAAAPVSTPAARIRLHTRTGDMVRPAVLRRTLPPQSTELPRLFAAAQYDWDEPFTAHAFTTWRKQLAGKRDRVERRAAAYFIETSSDSNSLARATLVLRASDLAPVRETLEFRASETVEISAAADGEATGTVAPIAPRLSLPGDSPLNPAPIPPVVLQLRVLAALHTIGADLGEVEFQVDGRSLTIQGAGLGDARRNEIRGALLGLDGTEVRFLDETGAVAPVTHNRAQNRRPGDPAPLRALLEAKLRAGESVEDVVNRILDTSDAMMAQAFALRSLARRYPAEAEASLDEPDRNALERLRGDYTRELRGHFAQLQSLLTPLVSSAPPAPAAAGSWQESAAQALVAVQTLDAALSASLAGPARDAPGRAALLQQVEETLRHAQGAVEGLR